MISLDAKDAPAHGDVHDPNDALCHWFSTALEVVTAVTNMHWGSQSDTTEEDLLRAVRDQITRLIDFEAISFALVDDQTNEFRFLEATPVEQHERLMAEVNRRIEDGHFAWTLRQIRPVIVPTQQRGVMLLMCTLATRNRIRGMFASLFSSETMEISEAALNLLQIMLTNTASALESISLYDLLKQKNVELEQRVQARTQDLEIALRDADAANRAKSAFIANMSHEIRTPLTSIIGYADLLCQAVVPEDEQAAALNSIARGGRHLMQLVSDILDMSKIESGRCETERVSIELEQILADVESIAGPQAGAKGLEFHSTRSGPLPGVMDTDPLRLRQILLNLLGNAIKFTSRGEVVMVVRGIDDGRAVEFEVTDTGIGIAPDRRDDLFQPFYQADLSVSRRFGGTGLGLYLSRQYAHLLGGELLLDGDYGGGSRFRLQLPVVGERDKHVEAAGRSFAEPADGGAADLRGRVLVADDTPENRHLIKLYLSAIAPQVAVETATNGAEAVEAALSQAFGIVLMDLQMPELDGLAATRLLRGSGYRGVIVAVSASAMEEDRSRCLEAGFDDFVTKPIDERALRAVVIRHLTVPDGGNDRDQVGIEDMPEFKALQAQFLGELRSRIQLMQDAYNHHDHEELAKQAHKLKGIGGSFGYAQITESAGRLERAVRGGDGSSVQSALDALLSEVDGAC